MKPQNWFFAVGFIVSGFAVICVLVTAIPLSAQNCPVTTEVRTICKQMGNVEIVSVSGPFGAYPTLQPIVYWHDDEWKIDMLPNPTSDGELRMQITSRNGSTKIVNYDPVFFAQVDSITRNPEDEAIVIGEENGTSSVFSIVDLKSGQVVAGGLLYDPSISPDRRFLLYENWYLPHVGGENLYSLYDTLKTLDENTCGYGENNFEYKKNSDQIGITQIYPHQTNCLEGEDRNDDNRNVSNFIWADDSSKVVFANAKSGVISLILVKMPKDVKEHPHTLIYSFVGAENVCGDVGPLGPTSCDSKKVKSIAWNGDSVNVVLVQANPTGRAILKNLTIPLSKFVPLSRLE